MKFYKENNINPAASCLPLLVQFPVFIALYLVLKHFATHQPGDNLELARPRPEHHRQGHGALVGLRAARRLRRAASSPRRYFMSRDDGQDAADHAAWSCRSSSSRSSLNFPVGLVLYWVTTNLWTVGQGLVTRRLMPRPAAPAEALVAHAARRRRRPTARRPAPEPSAGRPRSAVPQPRSVKRKKKKARDDDRDGSCRSRRPARPSARPSGRAARARAARARARQGGGPLPGRLGGRARPARRRLRAGARGRLGGRRGCREPPPAPPADEGELGRRGARRCSSTIARRDRRSRPDRDRGGRRARDGDGRRATSSASLIGKHGQTIDAIQYLANAIVWRGRGDERKAVVVDAAGYRARREETLEALADAQRRAGGRAPASRSSSSR